MFFQVLFILLFVALNYFSSLGGPLKVGFIVFFVVLLVGLDFVVKKVPFHKIIAALIIWLLACAPLFFIVHILNMSFSIESNEEPLARYFLFNISLLAIFFSVRLGATSDYFKKKGENELHGSEEIFVVDTSAVIDGRIVEVCESGFLSPHLIIPEFVVKELQLISDSSNHEKRKKGRRGLDLLNRMKNSEKLSVQIANMDYDAKGVDNKLLVLAKEKGAAIVTTDFNLMKVAELDGIKVLNINKLATILKPYYNVGDKIKVTVIKKGNNPNQGVSYLEDDTMVVVEDGEQHIGKLKQVVVTSYVQSDSGKMVFCKIIS